MAQRNPLSPSAVRTSTRTPVRSATSPRNVQGAPDQDLDRLTLDQLRLFVAIAESGSFTAAGRRLFRVQSAVSHGVGKLEEALEVKLFDRSTRTPKLTPEGEALLPVVREALLSTLDIVQRARALRAGLEAEVSIVFDAIFPTDALADLAHLFADEFPSVALRLGTETLSAVSAAVERGTYALGVCGPAAKVSPALDVVHVGTVRLIPVASASHPLATLRRPLSARQLQQHTQVVLSERGQPQGVDDVAVVSGRTWRVVDLHTKHILLRRGQGWGNLPQHLVREDLDSGALVPLKIAAWGPDEHLLGMRAISLASKPLGPASTWVLSFLPELCRARA